MSAQAVLITGALTGIGRAAAVAFAKKGAKVVVAALDFLVENDTVETLFGRFGNEFFGQGNIIFALDATPDGDDHIGFGVSSPLWDYVFRTTRK